jgi:hypothetical protein
LGILTETPPTQRCLQERGSHNIESAACHPGCYPKTTTV